MLVYKNNLFVKFYNKVCLKRNAEYPCTVVQKLHLYFVRVNFFTHGRTCAVSLLRLRTCNRNPVAVSFAIAPQHFSCVFNGQLFAQFVGKFVKIASLIEFLGLSLDFANVVALVAVHVFGIGKTALAENILCPACRVAVLLLVGHRYAVLRKVFFSCRVRRCLILRIILFTCKSRCAVKTRKIVCLRTNTVCRGNKFRRLFSYKPLQRIVYRAVAQIVNGIGLGKTHFRFLRVNIDVHFVGRYHHVQHKKRIFSRHEIRLVRLSDNSRQPLIVHIAPV